MSIEEYYDMRVKVTNLKTGEIIILAPELVDKALEMAKEEWMENLLHGYYRQAAPLTPGPKPSPPEE